ncbi:MAG: NUDIX hydrolase [Salinimicrobium sediminis]|uniref:ADP-ribose pyrophosphatase YjhB, NUDIX family n=1 Tax=Salinimicrobium sediminis TaxID=1343891 RepID=A0A285X8Z7_9FLAO|nr:NUDIX hydrolase [Salinimicrobium sediminis]MDX1601871.1 NUDIX hydrolase [Salinimicrobium sediminis]SOC80899.1 ADP-ribose pyrophosphatase YjhB, NUDIX family [Salinimicrobium sediminis]
MYKVFVNDIPIILSTERDMGEKYISFPLKEVKLKRIIKKINKGKLLYVNLYHDKKEKLLKHLFKKLPVVTAGGGMVLNSNNEVLFIYRNGRWDLPKGKVEKNESIEAGAIREVEEETGVKNLKISKFLQTTYHIFQRKGRYRLKVTYWYEMTTDYTGELVPEEKEGIKKVKWKNMEKAQKALTKSYANIKLLFPEEVLPLHSKDGISHM